MQDNRRPASPDQRRSPARPRVFYEDKLVYAIWEERPVTPGHALILPRRPVSDWFAASPAEQRALMDAVTVVRDRILERHLPHGFSIGIHTGVAARGDAGLQVHVIPRYESAGGAHAQPAAGPVEQLERSAAERAATDRADSALDAALADTDAGGGLRRQQLGQLVQLLRDVFEAERGPAAADQKRSEVPPAPEGARAPGGDEAPDDGATNQDSEPEADRNQPPEGPADEQPEADPAEASISTTDVAFFASDYDDSADPMQGDFGGHGAGYDDSMLMARPRSAGRRWLIALVLLVLAGGGAYGGYRVYRSPYLGEPPEHLRVNMETRLSYREEARRAARRAAGGGDGGSVAAGDAGRVASPSGASARAGRGNPQDSGTTGDTPSESGRTAGRQPGGAAAGEAAGAKAAGATGGGASASNPPGAGAYRGLVQRARKLLAHGRRGKAVALLRKALAANPSGWEALEQLAWAQMQRGRTAAALRLARRALGGNPKAPYAHLVVGAAMHERGRKGAAKKHYKLFLAGCPRCREARDIRQALRAL